MTDDRQDECYARGVLDSIASAPRFNRWIVRTITPSLGRRILEVGSGIGNVSRWLPRRERLTLSDRDTAYMDALEHAFGGEEAVDVRRLDLACDADVEPVRGAYDTVVCLNVLEHVEDDVAALRRMRAMLVPGGRVVLQVPQYEWLTSRMDHRLGHHRRYTAASLAPKLATAGLALERQRSFNALGLPGWLVNARLLGRTRLGAFQLKVFDRLVPLASLVERVLPLPGLSLVAVARVPD